jgi:hypothetical protein
MHPVLLRSEETSAVLVIALSGAVAALVAKGNGPLSPDGLVSRVLSNPVSRMSRRGRRLRTDIAEETASPMKSP